MTTQLLVLYAITSFYLFLGSLHWESRLRFQFGKEYEDYQKEFSACDVEFQKKE